MFVETNKNNTTVEDKPTEDQKKFFLDLLMKEKRHQQVINHWIEASRFTTFVNIVKHFYKDRKSVV